MGTALAERPPRKTKLIWEPLQGSQTLAMTCRANHILYEGTRGPGKTDAQLMYFRQFVGMGYGQFWRGVIFDREYKNLDDLISKSKRWFRQIGEGAKFHSSPKDLKWVWPTGEELWFRTMKTEQDYWNYHGQEFPFMGWNELTKHPNLELYDMSMSLNRTSFVPELHSPGVEALEEEHGENWHQDPALSGTILPEIPLVVFSTTNPYGPGHGTVKARFVDPARAGEILRTSTEVFNPRNQKREVITTTQVRLFGSYRENKFLSPQYVAELEGIKDKNKRSAWLHGNWDITSGGMFDDVWSSEYNVVPDFQIPNTWFVFRSFDWGSSKPFSVGWWAESDGCDVQLPDGTWISTIRGDIFRINEWYGWDGTENKGLRMIDTQIAKGIVEREIKMRMENRVQPGPADNSINDDVNGVCIARNMAKRVMVDGRPYNGPTFSRSIKAAGSRKTGWELMRTAIYNAQPSDVGSPREEPGLFVFRHACRDGFLRTVPTIPRSTKDLDDVDTDAEDHAADETRYVVLAVGERFVGGSGKTIGSY